MMSYQTEVISTQPQVTITNYTVTSTSSDWTSDLCDCCGDCGICLCGTFIPCILACKVAQDHGESCCLPCLPGALIALRTSIRDKYQISSSLTEVCHTETGLQTARDPAVRTSSGSRAVLEARSARDVQVRDLPVWNFQSLRNMVAQMYRGLISVAVLASFLQPAMTYSFMNCIESANSNHTTFRCTKRQAQSVHDMVGDLPRSATNLTVAYCKLSYIPSRNFSHLPKLRILALNNNQVKQIHQDAFVDLVHLQTLNLSSNYISDLSPSLFRGLYNLTDLLLADNSLTNLPLNLFSDLTSLNTLDLRRNKLVSFLAVVQSISSLSVLKKLDLSFNRLTDLGHSASDALPQSLAVLYIGNNNLELLGCSREFLSAIKVLDLSYNGRLNTSAFYNLNMSSIKYLRLRSTRVSIITLLRKNTKVPRRHVDFSGLGLSSVKLLNSLCKQLSHYPKRPMKNMTLQSNSIHTLNRTAFSSCPPITDLLDLSLNDLKSTWCLEFLMGQTQLKKLRVEHNHLTKLTTCNKTDSFPNLRELSFRYNRILEVNGFAFRHVPNLTTLQLNINIIAYLDRNALSGLRDLVFLRLDNNLLTDVYAESFEDLHSLEKLLLRNNRISVIFNDTFHSLRRLTTLDLGGNKITHFEPQAFNGLDSLTK
ncbi:hypothetical protein NFI96_030212, partial [Prochilodus magdalenae]